jgi:hypothetical protein
MCVNTRPPHLAGRSAAVQHAPTGITQQLTTTMSAALHATADGDLTSTRWCLRRCPRRQGVKPPAPPPAGGQLRQRRRVTTPGGDASRRPRRVASRSRRRLPKPQCRRRQRRRPSTRRQAAAAAHRRGSPTHEGEAAVGWVTRCVTVSDRTGDDRRGRPAHVALSIPTHRLRQQRLVRRQQVRQVRHLVRLARQRRSGLVRCRGGALAGAQHLGTELRGRRRRGECVRD